MENKNKDPAFLFYSSDFLTGTMLMSDEQVGMYIKLMCLQHQKGHLKEKDMLNICKRHDEEIFSKFTKDDEGNYYNQRLEKEIEKRKKYSDSRRQNRLAKSKEEKTDEDMTDTSNTYVPHMENENENINKDINIIINNKKEVKKFITDVIDYLNKKINANYKATTKKTITDISARIKEGYSLEDFKTVIDKKYNEWNKTDMAKFLRPETLFGNKFEGYLNQKIEDIEDKPKDSLKEKQSGKPNKFHNFEQRISEYSTEEMEEIAARSNQNKLKKLGIGG